MKDDKRRLRQLKRQIKQAGNKRRRRYLKDVAAESDDFEYGRDRSDLMNEPRGGDAGASTAYRSQ